MQSCEEKSLYLLCRIVTHVASGMKAALWWSIDSMSFTVTVGSRYVRDFGEVEMQTKWGHGHKFGGGAQVKAMQGGDEAYGYLSVSVDEDSVQSDPTHSMNKLFQVYWRVD